MNDLVTTMPQWYNIANRRAQPREKAAADEGGIAGVRLSSVWETGRFFVW